nr:hypothetical protein [uncultured bacterium]
MTPETARRALLCERGAPEFTGIDFVSVVDHIAQDVLRVFFIVDPPLIDDPDNPGAQLSDAAPGPGFVTIEPAPGNGGAAEVTITGAAWVLDVPSGRTALEVTVAEPGDFSIYELAIHSDAMDRFFAGALFSFKQGCESPFDCRDSHECPDEDDPDVAVDYLARDFESYRRALLDFAAQHFPDWAERTPADAAVMLSEVMAALADEMSFLQDRLSAQTFLDTATHPRALKHLARLVDHIRDKGATATAALALSLAENAAVGTGALYQISDRIAVWAAPDAGAAVPFELGTGLDDRSEFWAHSHWNAMALHQPDPSKPCLAVGATEAFLAPVTLTDGSVFNASPLTGALPPGSPLTEEVFWIGRRMIFRSVPEDPAAPSRAWEIAPAEVEIFTDALAAGPGDPPVVVTRIAWAQEQALPFELPVLETALLGNIVDASAGRTIEAEFRIGADDAHPPALWPVPRAAEREGPLDATTNQRGAVQMFGLIDSAVEGLAWRGGTVPDILLDQVGVFDPPDPTPTPWEWRESLLDGDEQARIFTLEPGLVAPILSYERLGEVFTFQDHAGSAGFTIRLGDGTFGRRAEPGDLFLARFRTNPGPGANLPAGSIRFLTDPGDGAAVPHAALGDVTAVTNPIPSRGARAAETAERTRLLAPELYKLNPLRAVVSDDYRNILGRISWVQQAAAPARHTGTWLTRFATADPFDATGLSPQRLTQLSETVDCIRMAGREVHVVQPKYAPIDLLIVLCLVPGAFPGEVREAVLAALSDREGGFFDPDAWTFGDPLRRSELEATIQCVPGVLGVRRIEFRLRGTTDWKVLTGAQINVDPMEIIQLRNDPRYPGQGSIAIRFDNIEDATP